MNGFGELTLAFGVFLLSHSIPPLAPVRARLISRLGRRGYLAAYSVVSTAILVWLISAALRAPYVALWGRPDWSPWVPLLVMPIAFTLLVGGIITPNPLSVSFRAGTPRHPGVLRFTRHPVLWAGALWAGAHLVANGDVAAVMMFGLFAALALAGMPLMDMRSRKTLGEAEWRRLVAQIKSRRDGHGLARAIVLGLAAYGGFLALHPWLIGVSPLPG
jgi:uncharacterized membrane protein